MMSALLNTELSMPLLNTLNDDVLNIILGYVYDDVKYVYVCGKYNWNTNLNDSLYNGEQLNTNTPIMCMIHNYCMDYLQVCNVLNHMNKINWESIVRITNTKLTDARKEEVISRDFRLPLNVTQWFYKYKKSYRFITELGDFKIRYHMSYFWKNEGHDNMFPRDICYLLKIFNKWYNDHYDPGDQTHCKWVHEIICIYNLVIDCDHKIEYDNEWQDELLNADY